MIYPNKSIALRLIFYSIILIVCSCRMVVQAPPKLVELFAKKYPQGQIPYSIANYGSVPYGKTISGQIMIPTVLEDCVYEDIPDTAGKKIILVQRNDCTFTQKSINVQKQGGKLAVIMDNIIENPGTIVMADDGKGMQVHIPTILISKEDGEIILEFLQDNNSPKRQKVAISVSFDIVKKQYSDVNIWLDITDRKNFIFLRNFKPYFNKISKHINLTVSYSTTRCSTCSPSNCYYTQKYCVNPNKPHAGSNAGQEIIKEQLRQFFIFQNYQNLWWSYMNEFDDYCNDYAIMEDCSQKIMKKLKINEAIIMNKVRQTFQNDDNLLLAQFSNQKYNNSIIFYPSIVVNSIVYRGNLEPLDVFQIVCQSLSSEPSTCKIEFGEQESNVLKWVIIGIAALLFFIVFLIVCFRRIARRQLSTTINKQVNELVNQYITMYQNQKFNEKPAETELQSRKQQGK